MDAHVASTSTVDNQSENHEKTSRELLDEIMIEMEKLKGGSTKKGEGSLNEVKMNVKLTVEFLKERFAFQSGRNSELEKRNNELEKKIMELRKPNYSNAVRNGVNRVVEKNRVIQEEKQSESHVVLVYPNDENVTSKAFQESFVKSIQPGKAGINVEKIERIRKGGILVKRIK